ncbi:MAG: hypothetical protein HY980_01200, partial [Candidatus Magasanikbacteria bacterium]|nr:hypothetical protein [Candidatus Magasanikbacteria bacterium]
GTNLDRVLLAVQNNGTNKFAISGGGNVYATAGFNANSTQYGIGDVAEYVNIVPGESVEPGDVVVADLSGVNKYERSSEAYAKNVAGIISDTGAFVMGAGGENRAALALAGLVRTKVTDENGPIQAGDYLVTASRPGYAMKYDPDSGQSAAFIGLATEALSSGEGKIIVLINKGFVTGAAGVSQRVNLNVSANANGQLVSSSDLDLAGNSLLNVFSIKSKNNKWEINDEGYLVVKVKTKEGEKSLYGLQTGQEKELVISGSSQLENGEKKIVFDLIDQEIIDREVPLKVTVTLTGEAKGIYVKEKTYQGFIVKELGGGASQAGFDWMVIAKRRAVAVEETLNNEEGGAGGAGGSSATSSLSQEIPVMGNQTPVQEDGISSRAVSSTSFSDIGASTATVAPVEGIVGKKTGEAVSDFVSGSSGVMAAEGQSVKAGVNSVVPVAPAINLDESGGASVEENNATGQ